METLLVEFGLGSVQRNDTAVFWRILLSGTGRNQLTPIQRAATLEYLVEIHPK